MGEETVIARKILNLVDGVEFNVAVAEIGIATVKVFAMLPMEDRIGIFREWYRAASDALAETML